MTGMYHNYFGLVAPPFSIAPDPRYLYMSQRHQEALATLLYGLRSDGGFVLLTGEVGAGKTTICRCLLEQIPEGCDVAYLFNPKLTVVELLSTICDEFGVGYPPGTTSVKQFVDLINTYLLESHGLGRRAVLIIDEAQNLSADVLEQMRLLTNLETSTRKLLQIVLLGQPELKDMLARRDLRQLAQRIVARYHLKPLEKREIAGYVQRRLEVSGAQRTLFPESLCGTLYKLSGGIPRVINLICDRALLGAFAQGKQQVDHSTLAQAAREVLPPKPRRHLWMRRALLAALALMLLLGALLPALYQEELAGATVNTQAGAEASGLFAGTSALAASKPPPRTRRANSALAATLNLPPTALGRSKQVALATLAEAWNVNLGTDGDPCTQLQTHGLQCRFAKGGLGELRQLNVPVVLHLLDDNGRKFYAALTGLGGNFATFSFGKETRLVGLSTFVLQWSGEYTTLLRLPPAVHDDIRIGERGPAVEWLVKQLIQVQGGPLDAASGAFDSGLESRLRRFQLAQGLTPDGVAGFKTLARLSVEADPSAPRLSRARERG